MIINNCYEYLQEYNEGEDNCYEYLQEYNEGEDNNNIKVN
jgi:hypothetical protein